MCLIDRNKIILKCNLVNKHSLNFNLNAACFCSEELGPGKILGLTKAKEDTPLIKDDGSEEKEVKTFLLLITLLDSS